MSYMYLGPTCIFSAVSGCSDNNGGCDHTCVNTTDSYYCTCNPGFILIQDGKTCEGQLPRAIQFNVHGIIFGLGPTCHYHKHVDWKLPHWPMFSTMASLQCDLKPYLLLTQCFSMEDVGFFNFFTPIMLQHLPNYPQLFTVCMTQTKRGTKHKHNTLAKDQRPWHSLCSLFWIYS